MGNSFVIYLFIFPLRAALQSRSLPGVSGLGGGPLEFGAGQTSYFLAGPAKAFEDEEGMERRGDAGMLRTPAGCSAAFPAGTEYFAGGADISQPGRKTASSPKELDSGETKRERKGWKKPPSRGPTLAPLPFASSRGASDGGRGLRRGVCRRRPKPLVSHGVWGEAAVTWPWLWQGLRVPRDRDLPQKPTRNAAFADFPLHLNPCSTCISATVEMNSVSNSWRLCSKFLFLSLLTYKLFAGFRLRFLQNRVCSEPIVPIANDFPKCPSLCSRAGKRK